MLMHVSVTIASSQTGITFGPRTAAVKGIDTPMLNTQDRSICHEAIDGSHDPHNQFMYSHNLALNY
jgi:hypothetical protein